uniref:Uncharacterized protein n=1 Tax=uncultured marine microorganism HF4000_48F7 TaxID=455500 RepID=B3SZT5_9ZZZZ|nr:hypothetical protein ALOHA_HF400048F7ctg1g10 [uncultured marine microorganism HF4000_48F7]
MCDARKKTEKLIETNVRGFTESAKTNLRGAADTLGINTEQDYMPKIKINMPTLPDMSLNLDQDLSRISVRGLQEEAVKRGGQIQQELIKIGTAGQEALVRAGAAAQAQAVRAGAAMQENAVQFGKKVSGGQSNPTLEGYAEQLTKGAESQAAQVTKYMEEKVIPAAGDAYATAFGDKNPQIKFIQGLVKDAEGNTGGIEALQADIQNFFNPLTPSEPQAVGGDNLAPAPTIGDPDELPMEQATAKAGQMSEEERLRRMRRLLLNRYGREDTILSGAGDTRSRRRYAL